MKYTEIFLYAHIILAKTKDRDRKCSGKVFHPQCTRDADPVLSLCQGTGADNTHPNSYMT